MHKWCGQQTYPVWFVAVPELSNSLGILRADNLMVWAVPEQILEESGNRLN
jgi:hypothetical protein